MTHYVLDLTYKDPRLEPGPNSEVGRLIRDGVLRHSSRVDADRWAVELSKFNIVSRVTVTLVTETPVGVYRNGART